MELVASFQISSVVRAPLGLLWQSVREVAGVSRREFDTYFKGLQTGVAIRISDVTEFRNPIPLDELRAVLRGFNPPQGFRYLGNADIRVLNICELRRAA